MYIDFKILHTYENILCFSIISCLFYREYCAYTYEILTTLNIKMYCSFTTGL